MLIFFDTGPISISWHNHFNFHEIFFMFFIRSKIVHCHTWWVLIIIMFSCHQSCEIIRRFFFLKSFFVFDLNIPVVFCVFTEKTIQFAHKIMNNVPCACLVMLKPRRTDRVFIIFLYDELMTNGIRCSYVPNGDICLDYQITVRPFSLIKQNNEKISKLVHVN